MIFLTVAVCNVSISSRSVAARSGLSWVQIKSPELEGLTSCWWRLHSAPGQRIGKIKRIKTLVKIQLMIFIYRSSDSPYGFHRPL